MKVLITGGNGFIGSALTRRLLALGHTVLVLDDFSSSDRNNLNDDVEQYRYKLFVMECNVTDNDMVNALFNAFGPDIVVHLAAELSIYDCNRNPDKAIRVNVNGSMNIFNAAIKHDAKVIMAESSAVYENCELPLTEDKADPTTIYACTKHSAATIAKALSRTHGLRYNMLRYFNVTGAGIDYTRTVPPLFAGLAIRLLANKPVIIFGDETRRRDFIHIDDVTDFNVMLVLSGSKYDNMTFNIGTGLSYSLFDIADMMATYLRKELRIDYQQEINGEAHTIVADMTHTRNSTGFAAKHCMSHMVVESADYCITAVNQGKINLSTFMTDIKFNDIKIGK